MLIYSHFSALFASKMDTALFHFKISMTFLHLSSLPILKDSFRPVTWLCPFAHLLASRQLLSHVVCWRLIQCVIKKKKKKSTGYYYTWLFDFLC